MRALRARLIGVAIVALAVQIAGFAMAPAALCCLAMDAAEPAMPCCKDAGPGHICPLMKKKAVTDTSVSLRPCCNLEQQVFTALLGLAGLPAPSTPVLVAPPAAFVAAVFAAEPRTWHSPVESPPPRA